MTSIRRPAFDDMEFADNPEPRCTGVILVDTSGSMQIDGRIDKINEARQGCAALIKQDSLTARRVDVAIISFNRPARARQPGRNRGGGGSAGR